MLMITLTSCRARRNPGLSGEIAFTVPADTVGQVLGDPVVLDGLTWQLLDIEGEYVWIAESAPNQTPILMPKNEKDSAFDVAFRFVMKHEGGYLSAEEATRQGDRGGETKYGIAKRFHPEINIQKLTLMEAKEIYYREYWIAGGCVNLPDALAVVHFDACVNTGAAAAHGFLLHSRGTEPDHYCQLRREYYREIGKQQPQFLEGWLRRVDEIQKLAESLA